MREQREISEPESRAGPNMLPIGQALWLRHLETYVDFPPLQNPASYNLDQVLQAVKEMKTSSHAGH